MSEHTPGPWQQSSTGLSITDGKPDPNAGFPHGRQIASMSLNHEPAERLANARRIVAAVNATEGIPTESLEKIPPGTMGELLALVALGPLKGICSHCGLELYGDTDPKERMRQHQMECPKHPMRAVERQRDELLAACEAALGALPYPDASTSTLYKALEHQLQTAIAQTRGS